MSAEDFNNDGSTSLHGKIDQIDQTLVDIDPDEERKAVRKLDYTILPIMTMFYLLSFLDRANIGNARVAGLQTELKLTDTQYQIAVTTTFVPYILAELPSNLLLRRIGPNILMPTILIIWGLITSLQGTVTNYHGLVVARAFLGLVEGPMFPGIVLYLSGFYTRKELSLRIALFFSAASLSGAFSGLLAAAIINMDGIGGKPGWAWIFILEGIFTSVIGIIAIFIVPGTPRKSKFLTDRQKDIIVRRLVLDRPTTSPLDTFSFYQVLSSLKSPHVLIVFVALFMNGTTLYGLAFFLPSIVNQLGFSATRTQLISVGPFALAFVVTIASAYLSDRYQRRAFTAVVVSVIAVIGFSLFLGTNKHHLAYGSLFLSVSGVYATPPILSAWMANNSEPHYRRATSVALGFVATNCGGILSTWSFPKKEGPRYRRATIMDLTFECCIIVLSLLNVVVLSWATERKQNHRNELLAPYVDEKTPDGGDRAWAELGDQHPDFRYAT
ncbi:MFS general substrate transporter [Rickenella mellea]|uniref:MFS general substrate transporter n=1 Tax=Rickenella mellea TaxID=50990 RepID=A0A4Y7PRK5_9AGAM|nr:MFS general substrate transporter [Rickenella mellea]